MMIEWSNEARSPLFTFAKIDLFLILFLIFDFILIIIIVII